MKVNWQRVLAPGGWWTAFLTLFCGAALLIIFTQGLAEAPWAPLLYTVAAYTCCLLMAAMFRLGKRLKRRLEQHAYAGKWLSNWAWRAQLTLYAALPLDLAYAAGHLALGVVYRSFWSGTLAAYYGLLAAARGVLLLCARQAGLDRGRAWRVYRGCGWLLLILALPLAGIVLQMVMDGRGCRYPGYMIYVAAAYAFYALAMAMLNMRRLRRLDDPILAAAKLLTLVTALVAVLSLQTAMFAAFGSGEDWQQLMDALTGGAVCLLIMLLAGAMLSRAHKALRNLSKTAN